VNAIRQASAAQFPRRSARSARGRGGPARSPELITAARIAPAAAREFRRSSAGIAPRARRGRSAVARRRRP
jgi:hypothetical protein